MSRFICLAFALCLFFPWSAFAAVFIVPDDRELVGKADGIVIGVVLDGTPRLRDDGYVETVYRVRIQRTMKGDFRRGSVIQVVSPGGIIEKRMTAVVGSAHFRPEDRVVLFLSDDNGRWTPTDMTLGKFRFVTSTGGQSLLLRDEEDIVGFDRQMRTHVERIRREQGFLKFIEATTAGRDAEPDYFIPPGDAISIPQAEQRGLELTNNAVYAPRSYTLLFTGGGNSYPARWPEARMSASTARPYYKSSLQSASGLPDGGVAMITSGLAGWTNDCASYVNMTYAGTNGLLKDPDDTINTVIWNDPGGHITGSWTGSGVIATAYMSGDDFHTYNGETDWVSISDADVVVQDGLIGTESFMATAMSHEFGHAIGLRHSNTHADGTACLVSDECTTTAMMNSSVGTLYNYTLDQWDKNAINAIYPTACSPAPAAPTNLTVTASSASNVVLSWSGSDGATGYKVYRRTSTGSAYGTEIATLGPFTSHNDTTVAANTGYQYVVRATNAGGTSGDSLPDYTVTTGFTDTMAAGLSVKLVHFTELQTAVNALRTLGGLSAFAFTAPTPAGGVTVRKAHIDDLRTALNTARTTLGGSSLTFAESLTAGTTTIKASHLTELRNGVK
ncbi:MAG: fibronectin type III domain-containing protein [Thermoanaerobaculia bacterium]